MDKRAILQEAPLNEVSGVLYRIPVKNAPDEPVIFAFGRNIKKRPFPLLYGKQLAYFQGVTLTCGILP